MGLSMRLKTVAAAVTPGGRVADVGTDHAYVPIWLVEHDLAAEAIASDVKEGPLSRAETHIRERGLEGRIRTRLGSGLEPLDPEEVDTVIIAGMGGDLICRLLEARTVFFSFGKEFVLQPQSECFKVRHLLHRYGYRIDREWMVYEDGHYYVIIRGLPGHETYDSEWDYRYGKYLADRRDPVLLEYLKKEYGKRESILRTLKKQLENNRQPSLQGAAKDDLNQKTMEKDNMNKENVNKGNENKDNVKDKNGLAGAKQNNRVSDVREKIIRDRILEISKEMDKIAEKM